MDPSEASKMPGFVDFVSHKDIQGHNKWGIIADEEIFATEKVSLPTKAGIQADAFNTSDHLQLNKAITSGDLLPFDCTPVIRCCAWDR